MEVDEILSFSPSHGRYGGLDDDRASYRPLIGLLTVVRLNGAQLATKFKLAQTTSSEARSLIRTRLEEQGTALARATSEALRNASS